MTRTDFYAASRHFSRAFFSFAIFLLAATAFAAASSEIVIHNFAGGTADGAAPTSALVADKAGNLYGTTPQGGSAGNGIVFKLAPQTNGTWTESVLYSFPQGGANYIGFSPGSLIVDSAGNLYGTAIGGTYGSGLVYELSPSNGHWSFAVLYQFRFDGLTYFDGSLPNSGLVRDTNGNLYGTTYLGGAGLCYSDGAGAVGVKPPKGEVPNGCGTVFELSLSSKGVWREKLLYSFQGGADGAGPVGNLTLGAGGKLFGTASAGGVGGSACIGKYLNGCGSVFELSPGTGGTWAESTLYDFSGGSDGGVPVAGVILDKSGNVYGATPGGFFECGSVFELSPTSGGTWTETTIVSFLNEADGFGATGGLIMDRSGTIYATTQYGSGPATTAAASSNSGGAPPPKPFGPGTLLELTPGQGGTWTTNWVHTFSDTPDGSHPVSGLIRGPDGSLYGTTSSGGSFGGGTVFKFVP
jgi:uncharacterized repeat protein (TIGR03803 family)